MKMRLEAHFLVKSEEGRVKRIGEASLPNIGYKLKVASCGEASLPNNKYKLKVENGKWKVSGKLRFQTLYKASRCFYKFYFYIK